jgi:alpha-amylase
VAKEVSLSPAGMKVSYTLSNRGQEECSFLFAPEFNIGFSYAIDGEKGELTGIREWKRKDDGFGLTVQMDFDRDLDLWTFPLETVSLSEGGFERTYQGTVVLPLYRVMIPAQSAHTLDIMIKIS